MTEETQTKKDIYTTADGLVITIVPAKPNLIQRAMRSVSLPKRPTYEVQTFGGRTREYPMDVDAAKETPHGEALWQDYVERRDDALAQQNEKSVMAIFLTGTRIDDQATHDLIAGDDWVESYEFLDIEVPTKFEMRKAFYLANELNAEDLTGLINAIMRTMGVDEDTIQDAEASFQRAVHNGTGPAGDMAESG